MGAAASTPNHARSKLVLGASEGDAGLVKELLDNHPELLKHKASHCVSLFHLAAQADHAEVLEELFSKAEDMQYINCLSQSPRGRRNLVQQVANSQNDRGVTPLMLAAEQGSIASVRLLLSKGADPWAADRLGGRTALHYAGRSDQAEICSLLIEAAAHTMACPPPPMRFPNKSTTKYVDMRTLSGFTAMHFAVHANAQRAVAVLLNGGANPYLANMYDSMEWISLPKSTTPLHIAARNENGPVARQLLNVYVELWQHRRMPDPRLVKDDDGKLPCHLAPGGSDLQHCLLPRTPLTSLFDGCEPEVVQFGPMSLARLAGAALRQKLTFELTAIEDQGCCCCQEPQQQQEASAAGLEVAEEGLEGQSCRGAGACCCSCTVGSDCSVPVASKPDLESAVEDTLCGVCLDAAPVVALAPCQHLLCAACCTCILRLKSPTVMVCPFCRRSVGSLIPA